VEIEPVAAAELQLEAAEYARGCLLRTARHAFGIAERDGERRGRPQAVQPEQAPGRHADELPEQVVQRRVDGGARSVLARREGVLNRIERPGVVREFDAVEPGEPGFDGLLVAPDRRALPEPGDPVVPDLDL